MRKSRISFFVQVMICCYLVVGLSILGLAKKKVIDSYWTDVPVAIDGMNPEWQDIETIDDGKLGIQYAFKNDAENLYLMFAFTSPTSLSSIESSGITIWLNPDLKKKRVYGIKFQRKMVSPEFFIALLEKQQGPLSDTDKNEIKKRPAYTIFQNGVVNKDTDVVIPIQVAIEQAPAFKMFQSPQMRTYEFKIPLKNVAGQVVGIGAEPGKVIMIGFEWGGMTKEIKAEMIKKRGYVSDSSSAGVSSDLPGAGEADGVGDPSDEGPSAYFASMRGPKRYNVWAQIKIAEKK